MKIGLFGGSFNPIHTGHLIVIDQAMEQLGLDKLIIMPAACNPLKMGSVDMASAEHRLTMAKIATADLRNVHPNIEISDMEIKRGAPSYTIDTVRELKREGSITLIVGGDSYNSLSYWKDINELAKLVTFGVAERNVNLGNQVHRAYPDGKMCLIKTTTIDIPTFDTSGTEVRGRIKEGRSIKYLVPDVVAEYIREHGMYLTK